MVDVDNDYVVQELDVIFHRGIDGQLWVTCEIAAHCGTSRDPSTIFPHHSTLYNSDLACIPQLHAILLQASHVISAETIVPTARTAVACSYAACAHCIRK